MKIKINKIGRILKNGLSEGNPFSFDSFWTYHPIVLEKDGKYYMFYSGRQLQRRIRNETGLAESYDLIHWKKYSKNPVFPVSKEKKWDSDMTGHSYVFKDESKYFMLYDGSKKENWLEEIGLAESSDLIHWKRYKNNPILKVGKNWWEKRHVSRCCVYKERGIYYLYYAGHDGNVERIGLAKGKSLLSLKRVQKEPVLDLGKTGSWDERTISDPRVLKYKNKYLMLFSGVNHKGIERTGLAESSDLIHWKKYSKNPILDVSKDSWDKVSATRADIKQIGNQLYIFYSGRKRFSYSIGTAKVDIYE